MKFYNVTNQCLIDEIQKADDFFSKSKGLLFAHPDQKNHALWMVPCQMIHTVGMRWPLDIIFLNRQLRVLKVVKNVGPFHLFVGCPGAHSVLEFFSGCWDASKIQVGNQLQIAA